MIVMLVTKHITFHCQPCLKSLSRSLATWFLCSNISNRTRTKKFHIVSRVFPGVLDTGTLLCTAWQNWKLLSVQLFFSIRQSVFVSMGTNGCYEDALQMSSAHSFPVSICTHSQMGPEASTYIHCCSSSII